MNEKTFEALEDIIKPLKYSMETNDFSYFILNPNPVNNNVRLVERYITDNEII